MKVEAKITSIKPPRHRTTWEDDRMAGVTCDGVYVGTIVAYGEDEPFICSQCGVELKLVWNVKLEQVNKS